MLRLDEMVWKENVAAFGMGGLEKSRKSYL